jgi:hypothetical protein
VQSCGHGCCFPIGVSPFYAPFWEQLREPLLRQHKLPLDRKPQSQSSSLLKNSRFGDDFVIQGFVVNLGGSDAGQV